MQFGLSSLVEVGVIDVVVAATVDVVRRVDLRRIETVVLDGATVVDAAVVVVCTGAVDEDEEDVEADAGGPLRDARFSDVHPPEANKAASAAAVMTWLRRSRRCRIRRIFRTSPTVQTDGRRERSRPPAKCFALSWALSTAPPCRPRHRSSRGGT